MYSKITDSVSETALCCTWAPITRALIMIKPVTAMSKREDVTMLAKALVITMPSSIWRELRRCVKCISSFCVWFQLIALARSLRSLK